MASACADRLQVGEVVSTIPSAHLAALALPRELALLPLTVPVTDKVCCATAIGFNVETVTYKNIKFQAGHPALHMLACIAALTHQVGSVKLQISTAPLVLLLVPSAGGECPSVSALLGKKLVCTCLCSHSVVTSLLVS